jgi:hypothetical protein
MISADKTNFLLFDLDVVTSAVSTLLCALISTFTLRAPQLLASLPLGYLDWCRKDKN